MKKIDWGQVVEFAGFYLLAGFVLLSGFTAVWGKAHIQVDIYPF